MGTHARIDYAIDVTYLSEVGYTLDPSVHYGRTKNNVKRQPEPAHASKYSYAKRETEGRHAALGIMTEDETFDTPTGNWNWVNTDPDETRGYTTSGVKRHGEKKHAITWENADV